MVKKIFCSVIIIFCISSFSFSQNINFLKLNNKKNNYSTFLSENLFKDTNKSTLGKSKVKKLNIGGLFLAPTVGYTVPVGSFATYSKSTFFFGLKFELAYSRLYPLVFSFIYESQKNSGSPEFLSANFLSYFNTQIISFGGGLDVILNKYFKSNFTTPVFSVEVKYANVQREAFPDGNVPLGTPLNEGLITYAAGLAFTIYVFDLSGRYTYGGNYSQVSFQLRIHLPIVKF